MDIALAGSGVASAGLSPFSPVAVCINRGATPPPGAAPTPTLAGLEFEPAAIPLVGATPTATPAGPPKLEEPTRLEVRESVF